MADDVKDGDAFAAALEAAEATAAASPTPNGGRAAPLPRHVLAAGLRLPGVPAPASHGLDPERRRAVELRDGPPPRRRAGNR